jgi:hypothetical protein
MVLADKVHVTQRFQRSVRIDTDYNELTALEGFICPQSSADVLMNMTHHLAEDGQGAFTWTGPYGSGKSSLVVALSGLLSTDPSLSQLASEAVGKETAKTIRKTMPPQKKGWTIIPVVGRREHPVQTIGSTLETMGIGKPLKAGWSESHLVGTLEKVAQSDPTTSGGVILFLDEMGKFLEGATQNEGDVYIFQQLAEAASRSNRRLIIVGILHQAFEEYASRLSREQRDEWNKIQGRFVDLPVNVAGEEQLSLISRAIEADKPDRGIQPIAKNVADSILEQRPAASSEIAQTLQQCWPIHPIVTCLLGPISRRRFGQNQRSIFGFLNSAEPQGLQDFLRHANDGDLYNPELLWDYLQYNLEPSILASPDGHRWSLAVEAVQRCEALGGEANHLSLLRTIALVDLFKERSGLTANKQILLESHRDLKTRSLNKLLKQLQEWSLIIERKFAGDYAIFAGSDFDIENAVIKALEENPSVDFAALKKLANIHPILAKRHYHKTGALRWFDVELFPVTDLLEVAKNYEPELGTIGQFILAIPTENESDETCQNTCRNASQLSQEWDLVCGLSPHSWAITEIARELLALEYVSSNSPELAGDSVARREVEARIADVQGQLEQVLQKAFDNTSWYRKNYSPKFLFHAQLNSLASYIADSQFAQCPKIHNELLNRLKPSSSAAAGQKALLKHMVLNEGEERLGIDGFPAHGGLFESLLEGSHLYSKVDDAWRFCEPEHGVGDPNNLAPLWQAAVEFLKENESRTVKLSEIYEIWRKAPYGVQDGLLSIIAVAFIQAQRRFLAFYRQGIFQARLKDLDIDYLVKDSSDIQLRWMDLTEVSRRILSGMAGIVRKLDRENNLTDLEPIDVARGLIAVYDGLPAWTQRTLQLSRNALRIRQIFKQANDPNKFLFDDLPDSLTDESNLTSESGVGHLVDAVQQGLEELIEASPNVLRRLRDTMLAELLVPNALPSSLTELHGRAENIRKLKGNLRLDAFTNRLIQFDGGYDHMEGIVSLAISKPPLNWIDTDLEAAAIEIADLAQKFIRAETFARVKGRKDKRQAMAVVIGINGHPTPIHKEFTVTDSDRADIDILIARLEEALPDGNIKNKNIVIAALAELSARYLTQSNTIPKRKKKATDPQRGELFS